MRMALWTLGVVLLIVVGFLPVRFYQRAQREALASAAITDSRADSAQSCADNYQKLAASAKSTNDLLSYHQKEAYCGFRSIELMTEAARERKRAASPIALLIGDSK